MAIISRIIGCFANGQDTFKSLRRKYLQNNPNIPIAICFIVLVLFCTVLRAIVLNPDYVTHTVVRYYGGEIQSQGDHKFMDFDQTFDAVYYDFRQPNLDEIIPENKTKTRQLTNGSVEQAMKRLPQCIIIGVRKSGTRALIDYLSIHPDIVAAKHEMHFFDNPKNYYKGLEVYQQHMPASFDGQITVEKTPGYFNSYWSPLRIKEMNDTIKLLVIVREPIARAMSDYLQFDYKVGRTKPFEHYAMKNGRVAAHYSRLLLSQYYFFTRRWLKYFAREQIHFVNGDTLIQDPAIEMQKVEAFLGLRPIISKDHFFFNKQKGFFCYRTHDNSEHCLKGGKGHHYQELQPEVQQQLTDFFRPYNKKFFDLIGEDFGWPT